MHKVMLIGAALLALVALGACGSSGASGTDWQAYVPKDKLGKPLSANAQKMLAEGLARSVSVRIEDTPTFKRMGADATYKIYLELQDPRKMLNMASVRGSIQKQLGDPIMDHKAVLVDDMAQASFYVLAVADHLKTASGGTVVAVRQYMVGHSGLIEGANVSHPFVEYSSAEGAIVNDYEVILDDLSAYHVAVASASRINGDGQRACLGNQPQWVDASQAGNMQASSVGFINLYSSIVATGALEPALLEGAKKFTQAHGQTMETCQNTIHAFLRRDADFEVSQSFYKAHEVSVDGKAWFPFEGVSASGDIIAAVSAAGQAAPEASTESFNKLSGDGRLAY